MEHQDFKDYIIRGGQSNSKTRSIREGKMESVMKKKVDNHMNKLDNEDDVKRVEKVNLDVRRIVQKVRTEKGMTQKELADRVNMKVEIIRDLESGKLSKNPQLLSKLQRVLGVRLLGKNIGEPFTFGKKKD